MLFKLREHAARAARARERAARDQDGHAPRATGQGTQQERERHNDSSLSSHTQLYKMKKYGYWSPARQHPFARQSAPKVGWIGWLVRFLCGLPIHRHNSHCRGRRQQRPFATKSKTIIAVRCAGARAGTATAHTPRPSVRGCAAPSERGCGALI